MEPYGSSIRSPRESLPHTTVRGGNGARPAPVGRGAPLHHLTGAGSGNLCTAERAAARRAAPATLQMGLTIALVPRSKARELLGLVARVIDDVENGLENLEIDSEDLEIDSEILEIDGWIVVRKVPHQHHDGSDGSCFADATPRWPQRRREPPLWSDAYPELRFTPIPRFPRRGEPEFISHSPVFNDLRWQCPCAWRGPFPTITGTGDER